MPNPDQAALFQLETWDGFLTRSEAVSALGLRGPRDLDKLVERGAPAPRPGKRGSARYDLRAIVAWRQARATSAGPALSDLATERAALARVQRELSVLRLQAARGELIQAKDAAEATRAIVVATRTQLLSVPRRCVLAGLPLEHEPTIKRLITEALRELSEVRTVGELERVGGSE